MKRTIALAIAVVLCIGAVFAGCAPTSEKSPDQFEGVRWITYDYSFCINPAEECKGYYQYGDTVYKIQATFDAASVKVVDTDKNTELFNADWLFMIGDNEDDLRLYVYNIAFNTADYKELESNLAEYVTLKKEEI